MSSNFDLHNSIFGIIAIRVQLYTMGVGPDGNIIDTNNAYALEFIINSGGIEPTGQVDFTLLHGEDPTLSDAEVVPDDSLIGTIAEIQLTAQDPGEVKRLGYVGKKRYVRLDFTTDDNVTFGATALKYLFREESSPTQP